MPNLDDDGLEQARHLLGPPVEPFCEDADASGETAAALRRQRRAGDAADLLQRGPRRVGHGADPLPTRLWMALGEARWTSPRGRRSGFDRAAEAADEIDVVTLTPSKSPASATTTRSSLTLPPATAVRCSTTTATPTIRHSEQVAGVRRVLVLQPPAHHHEASAFADAAVAMARRLDNPDALLTALCDRAFVVGSAEDVRRRKDLAEEVIELARISGRPDRAVAGHEGRFDDCLRRGDLTAAARALDEFEALASVAPSPFWRYASSFRRAMLLLVQGDRDGAVETIAASAQASSGLIDRFELIGTELGSAPRR